MVGRLRNYFLTGLILVGPLYITVSLTWWFINWVDDLVRPFIPVAYRPETYLPVQIPGTGLIIALIALTLLGFLTANLVGRTLVEARREHAQPHADRAADLQEPEADFRDAVLQDAARASAGSGWSSFRRPACGRWCSCRSRRAPTSRRGCRRREHVAAFMPCTPNPTTGFFFYVPRQDVIDLDISVEAAMTLLMSAGMVQPGGEPTSRRSSRRWPTPRASRKRRSRAAPPPPAK